MRLKVPDFGLVVLIGAAGAGKSTFAKRHFRASEILASDHYRSVVGDDERTSRTTVDAFDIIEAIAAKRLAARRFTVIDATNVQRDDRRRYVDLAREHHAPLTAIVLDLSEAACQAQNAQREGAPRPGHVVRRQWRTLRRSSKGLSREGFRRRYRLVTPSEAVGATVEREPLRCDRRTLGGPFDIIGDVHGCRTELETLLAKLGYEVQARGDGVERRYEVRAPEGRQAVFTGDLIDRGPDSVGVLRLVMDMVDAGVALVVQGNHDSKLARALAGHGVERAHGLAETMEQLEATPEAFRDLVREFAGGLPTHYVFDRGRLVVAHAGLTEELQGRSSAAVRSFALYGDTTGEQDDDGHPVRRDWAQEYRGAAAVVYGHTAVARAEWVNRTVCIDTGCVFGGRLTALRYPERETVSVDADDAYVTPMPAAMQRPAGDGQSLQQAGDRLLDVEDVVGRLRIHTTLVGRVSIRQENAAAALEIMSRFAIDPRWLIYLPPTMAPCDAAQHDGLLEHPAEAFAHFRRRGVRRVVCEEKHMGSRAVVVVARDAAAGERRFGTGPRAGGVVYTRTGRRFFDDQDVEAEVLGRIREALGLAGVWTQLQTEWACLDCEVMPWSAKGGGLVAEHYAPVAEAARTGLAEALGALARAAKRDDTHAELLAQFEARAEMAAAYDTAYRRYNWPVESVDDLKIAPFHLLATEGAVHSDKPHGWHLEQLDRVCGHDAILTPTAHRTVLLDDPEEEAVATAWWTERTAAGAEGMVVKPWDFVARGAKGIVTPALKCRGREYLRIIYGPEYTAEHQLERLRQRSTRGKLALALREFALGIQALEQFVAGAPLREVHRAVFGVLALEAEPVDPRL